MTNTELSQINEAINSFLNIKESFRETSPNFKMDQKHIQEIRKNLKKINKIVVKLNEKYGPDQILTKKQVLNLDEHVKNVFLIINASKNRKRLLELGLNPSQILATNGPLTVEDIKNLNPNISESALSNFKNKIENFWKIIKKRVQQGKFKKVFLVLEKNNVADEIIASNKAEFENKISIPIQILTISSFDELNPTFLTSIMK